MAEKRNSEGYLDPTAYQALRNIEKSERSKRKRMKRGEIYYIAPTNQTGSEQRSGRPGIIVSCNKCNEFSDVLEVVYLTTKQKNDLPTHVTIRSSERESTALCEQITPVAKSRIGDFKGKLTDTEMLNVEIAMLIGLGVDMPKQKVVEKPIEKIVEVIREVPVVKEVPVPAEPDGRVVGAELKENLAAMTAKCETLQTMYDSLLSRVLNASAG